MSHILNKSGAESDLFHELNRRGIHRFSSIDDLFTYKKNYRREIDDFREKTEAEISVEIRNLSESLTSLRADDERDH